MNIKSLHPSLSFGFLPLLSLFLVSCVSDQWVSYDHSVNYAYVFPGMRESKPVILNSRLERDKKSLGPIELGERNGEWEFEMLASHAWVNEVMRGFRPAQDFASIRKPTVLWWKPTERLYDAFEMQYTSFPNAHLYVEKHPKDEMCIHAYIQRH